LNYLKGLAQKNLARPFLFQNSLHHSTTGFLSQKYQLLGPCYSLCGIRNVQNELLELASSQSVPMNAPVLLIHSESFPEELAAISEYSVVESCEILFVGRDNLPSFKGLQKKMSFQSVFDELGGCS